MKKLLFLTLGLLLLGQNALYAKAKRYTIKSGIVEYQTSSSGSILGFGTSSEGTRSLYFKEYGNISVQEMTSQSTSMGHSSTTHTKTKFQNGMVYIVDEKRKVIIKKDMSSMMKDKNMNAMGMDMLESMGGKKVGSGKVLGYPCEIWEAMGSRMWFYKGVLLKLESNVMGIKTTEIATKAKFGVRVPESKFTLPNYPIQSMEEMMQEQIGKHQSQSQEEEPSDMPVPQAPKMEDVQKLLKGLGGMFGGK